MIALNLIPEAVREARANTQRLWLWAKGLGTVAVLAAAAMSYVVMHEHPGKIGWAAVGDVEAKIESRKRELASLRAKASAVAKQIESVDAVSHHPDWSGVLAMIAYRMSDSLVLESTVLNRPRDARASGPATDKAAIPKQEYALDLAGVAASQAAVHEYVADLQGTRLFDTVTLIETRSRVLNGQEMVSFRLTCTIVAPSDLTAGAVR